MEASAVMLAVAGKLVNLSWWTKRVTELKHIKPSENHDAGRSFVTLLEWMVGMYLEVFEVWMVLIRMRCVGM
jgi:hypothetical protein